MAHSQHSRADGVKGQRVMFGFSSGGQGIAVVVGTVYRSENRGLEAGGWRLEAGG
jgi:hypothetical protein